MIMRTAFISILSALAALFVISCASAPRSSGAGDGQALYRAHCASCHRLHDPSARTRAEWTAQVERMAARAHLSGEQRGAILLYLHANAKDARPTGEAR